MERNHICDMYNEDCVWQKCKKCNPRSVRKLFPFKNTDTVIEYYQWEAVIVYKKEKEDYRTTKNVMKIGTTEEAIEHLTNLHTVFSINNLTINNQFHNFKNQVN